MKSGNATFRVFMAMSLAVHIVLFAVVLPDFQFSLSDQLAQTLDLELGKSSNTVTGAEKKSAPARSTPAQTETSSVSEPALAEAVHSTDTTETLSEVPQSNDNASDENQINSASGTLAANELIRDKIAIEFARYFYYPDAARRRNWQGEVVLEFVLLQDGQLDQIRVQHSSGYRLLDDAAMQALQQLRPQRELALLTTANVLHVLPVSYRLLDL